ncbi:ATP-dependent Clp protease ATP-binding subunit ClpA homolog [Linum perenne]
MRSYIHTMARLLSHSININYLSLPKGIQSLRSENSKTTSVKAMAWFTEKAIKVIMLAQEEARRLGHNYVGTEQILLGLIGEGTGIAAKVLKSMRINLKDARVEVEEFIGRGNGFVAVEILFTPGAKRVLELSLEEARQLGHNYIGSEHLLLGLLREGEGLAALVLENLGADASNIRTQASNKPWEFIATCFI